MTSRFSCLAHYLRFTLVLVPLTLGISSSKQIFGQEEPSAVGPVMKLFKSGRLPAERQGTVVEMICNRGNEHDLRVIFDQLMMPEALSSDLKLKAIGWLTEASSTRKVKPTGDLSGLSQLLKEKEPAVKLGVIRLASSWKLSSFSESFREMATSPDSPAEVQKGAIEGLVAVGGDASRSTLIDLTSQGRPLPVRILAVSGLVNVDLKVASEAAAKVLKEADPQSQIEPMLNAFFDKKEGSDRLADSIKMLVPSKDVAKKALRYMYSIGRSDSGLSAVLSEAAGVATDPPPPTQEEVASLVAEVVSKGDAARGERVFRRNDLSCLRCHALHRAGGQIGPDLSAVGVSSPVDYVINSILNPNLAVKEQYVTKIFILDGGNVLTGVVVDRDDNRVLIRDAQGKSITIATADIEEEAEGKSLMPQGLTKFLTHEEVLDLSKFISELGKPGPYGIRKVPVMQRWRIMTQPPKELTQDVPHLESIRQFILNTQADQWTNAYSLMNGQLPLEELHAESTPKVLILRGEIQVNEAGDLAFQLSTSEKFQVWVDDQAFDSKTQFQAKLSEGLHPVTIRIEVSGNRGSFLKLEVGKPQDSKAQYEVVGGV